MIQHRSLVLTAGCWIHNLPWQKLLLEIHPAISVSNKPADTGRCSCLPNTATSSTLPCTLEQPSRNSLPNMQLFTSLSQNKALFASAYRFVGFFSLSQNGSSPKEGPGEVNSLSGTCLRFLVLNVNASPIVRQIPVPFFTTFEPRVTTESITLINCTMCLKSDFFFPSHYSILEAQMVSGVDFFLSTTRGEFTGF